MPSPNVTLVESRVVRAGKEQDFARWAERHLAALAETDGHCETVRLEQTGGLHHCVTRFRDESAFRAWRESPMARGLAEEAEPLSAAMHQQGTGSDLRFALPSDAAQRKWKRFITTWAAVLPVLLLLSTLVRWLVPDWPAPAQLLVTSPILTAILQWLILPRVQRWSRIWMLQDADGKLRREPG